jgi:Mg2+-importing ATPase
MATLLVVGLTLILPFSPLGKVFGFIPLPISFLLFVGIIIGLFMVAAEISKGIFYRKVKF